MTTMPIGRRHFIAAATAALLVPRKVGAANSAIDVYRDPSCGCCGGWVEHLKSAGYAPRVVESADLEGVKSRLGVPEDLWACHSAVLGAYVLEGHVPAHAVARLLAEKPHIRGVAVPGMPTGSPGMEGGEPELYDVITFGAAGRQVFGRYRGSRPA